ncbi:NADPH-dependent FMN reductase [Aeoliella mucimassa]|uniref:FMN-dependent NADPH-azoreductase n=1 Tax=Aeoliella mucimassa TaxID=2527972 RepID=A0A518APW5_9BACT|nr:NAD(P)H-dependent oxidoreductase [Aeoliella mucimassa]QDU56765.1 FMN-dependent NADPH-azoreductase [Aeoliella mucimassa]
MAKILAFAGSARRDSHNKKLVAYAAKLAREQGAEVTLVDLRDYEMPLYDGDLEEEHGYPEAADKLYELMKQHDALLIACPEYNGMITPLLKNTIDWVSRPREGDGRLAAYTNKVAAILSASPGALGGLRGLVHLRTLLSNIGVHVIPSQMAVSEAHKVFNEAGDITEESLAKPITDTVKQLVNTTNRLTCE